MVQDKSLAAAVGLGVIGGADQAFSCTANFTRRKLAVAIKGHLSAARGGLEHLLAQLLHLRIARESAHSAIVPAKATSVSDLENARRSESSWPSPKK